MPSAEIIAIGTELLLGETVDTNTAYITKALNALGIDIYRTVIVGDNPGRITRQIQQSLGNADIIVTTGGLGPTIDDPTREAIAAAFNTELVFVDDLWEDIVLRFQSFNSKPTDNNKRQAHIPKNAMAISNPVGTAPAFYVYKDNKIVISLPGVPSEMQYLMENAVHNILKEKFKIRGTIFSRMIHTAGIGESTLDSMIGDFEKFQNPTVGVTAKPGRVSIRVTAKAEDKAKAKAIIQSVENDLLTIIGDYVFGFDDDTLEDKLSNMITKHDFTVALYIDSSDDHLFDMFSKLSIFANVTRCQIDASEDFQANLSLYNRSNNGELSVWIKEILQPKHGYKALILMDDKKVTTERYFGGHQDLFHEWIKNHLFSSILTILREKVN